MTSSNCKNLKIKNFKILSWNIHSLLPIDIDLTLLIHQHDPDVIMLSETWMKPHYRQMFPGYNCFRYDRKDGYGGLITLIKTKYISYPISVDLNVFGDERIESQISKIMIDGSDFYFINFYIHTNSKISIEELRSFFHLNDLSNKSFLFWAGDFNAKHPVWGYPFSDGRGTDIFDFSQQQNLFNINSTNPQPTRKTAPGENKSYTDIAFCSLILTLDFEWEAQNTGSSDHFPCRVPRDYSSPLNNLIYPL